MHYLTLDDHWQIRPLDDFRQGIYPRDEEGWMPAHVPAHWQQLPGLEQHTGKAVYRCSFRLGDGGAAGERVWLRLNGAFYRSRPYLNGVDLGAHEGYFTPYEPEVTGLLQDTNTLLVEVDCPEERNKLGKTMVTGVFSHWDCLDPQANPGGIWLPVELHTSGPVRLQHARLLTVACDDHFAQVRFDLDLDAAAHGPVTLRLHFTPRTFEAAPQVFEQQRVLHRGHQEVGGLVKLRDPRLWWTHDIGRPDLYDVTVEVLCGGAISDQRAVTFGVRTFELRGWIAYLNGVRFLIKGNNYPPGDMRIATMTRERYDADLRLAREAHMNLLRVHAHVDHPLLYEAADVAGMLLWQDFPLQWVYDQQVLAQARRQARSMVRLLGSHPSVAIWCMHNEAFLIEDTADESFVARLRTQLTALGFSWNRDVMDTQLKAIAEQEDPTRPVIRSSGEFHIPYVREGTDGHAYFGWYSNHGTLEDAEMMQRRFPGNMSFMTEFGAQSFPNLESSRRFIPEPLTDEVVQALEARHGLQGEIMANWIPWREAGSLAEVVEVSQDYQIFINRYYIDRLRNRKYQPTGGIVAFLFVDPYPAVLWSVVDYWRVPKRSYHAMRLAFSPQYAYCLYAPRTYTVGEAITLPLSVVNDARRAILGARLEARLRDPAGTLLAEARHRVDLPADCLPIVVDRLRLTPTRPGRYALELALTGVDHEVRQVYEIEVT
ncbi:MAG: glycoside hydrolase [Chloroflexales bacterium]|nr:glycoside hydrolase [Chloroflexales bacterium]